MRQSPLNEAIASNQRNNNLGKREGEVNREGKSKSNIFHPKSSGGRGLGS